MGENFIEKIRKVIFDISFNNILNLIKMNGFYLIQCNKLIKLMKILQNQINEVNVKIQQFKLSKQYSGT